MEVNAFRLVALIPPGSVQAGIGKLQAALFDRFGLASSQAIAPLVPVQFLGAGCSESALLEQLDAATRAPWRMTTGSLSWVDGHLFLGIETTGTWSTLRAETRARCAVEPDALFPVAEGFFVGCGEASREQRDAVQRDAVGPETPPVSFSSCAIAVLKIETPRGRAQWWREVYWEVLEQKPLRGRRRP
jgi:hypothetical protein